MKVEDNRGETTFTVTNKTDKTLHCRIDLQADPPAKPEWLKASNTQFTLTRQAFDQVSVMLQAPVDAEGQYAFRIIAASEALPDEDFTIGPTISFRLAKKQAPPPPPPGIKWWMILIAAIILLGIVVGIVALVTRDKGMPDLTGKPIEEVELYLEKSGFTIRGRSFRASNEPAGTVVDQKPRAGEPVPAGKAVDLVISGAGLVEVPLVRNLSVEAATAALSSKGLVAAAERPSGIVFDQLPRPGIQVASGSKIVLFVR